jgi:hypothetical protein
MEDLAAFIIRAVADSAQKAKAAQETQIARAGQAAVPVRGQLIRRAKPAPTPVPAAPTVGAVARQQAASAAEGVERDDALVRAAFGASRATSPLLAPFTHPRSLLAAIVVSEALQPPLALRQRERP